jgi:anti-anti-sigma factor
MSLQLPKMAVPVLDTTSDLAGDVITTRFKGTADVEAQPDLQHYITAIHTESQRLKVTKVVVDFRELEFMNSSSFKIFVAWLAKVQDLPAADQYKISFLSNPNMHWQRRSLAALSCFAVDLVSIET